MESQQLERCYASSSPHSTGACVLLHLNPLRTHPICFSGCELLSLGSPKAIGSLLSTLRPSFTPRPTEVPIRLGAFSCGHEDKSFLERLSQVIQSVM